MLYATIVSALAVIDVVRDTAFGYWASLPASMLFAAYFLALQAFTFGFYTEGWTALAAEAAGVAYLTGAALAQGVAAQALISTHRFFIAPVVVVVVLIMWLAVAVHG